jgi:hypothetical protein
MTRDPENTAMKRLTINTMARVLSAIVGEFSTPVLIEILEQLHSENPRATEKELTRLLLRELTERIPRPEG